MTEKIDVCEKQRAGFHAELKNLTKKWSKNLRSSVEFTIINELHELTAKYGPPEERFKCDYCYRREPHVSKPTHLRQTDGKWTEQLYCLCDECREHMRGNFKYAKQ